MEISWDDINIHRWGASSLGEVINIISAISDLENGTDLKEQVDKTGRLWFRGCENVSYMLLPGLQRDKTEIFEGSTTPRYLESNLREEMRLQHFQARVYHLLKTVPDNTIGWQELEQHYSNRTRYLDWSESAIVSLSFAVRPYLVQTSKSAQKDFLPCLWVLNPRSLNRKGYQYFSASENSRQLIIQALSEFPDMHFDATNFQGELSKNSDLFFSAKKVGSRADNDEMEGIPCLSVLHDLASQTRHNLQNLLKQKEFNPYYYLLLRYYADGLPVFIDESQEEDFLPPLAVLQPYHSIRIKEQKGVFTIFPNYIARTKPIGDDVLTCTAMENQRICSSCLYHIQLNDPERIAYDLLNIGVRGADLYSEIDEYAREIEYR